MTEIAAGCFQLDTLPGDIDSNRSRVEQAIRDAARDGIQLLVLPEMWSCGFVYPRLKEMAARTPAVVERLRKWAQHYGMVLVGSLPEEEQGTVYNCSYVIDATGEVAGTYRKIHLFSLYRENDHFGAGRTPLVCTTAVGRLGVMICYDLRFPELARRLALDGATVLCVSALWPSTRVEHWSLLLRARAVENQLFVLGCNGCGVEGQLKYGGTSAILSPTGGVLAEASTEEACITARLRPGEGDDFRRHIPCFDDRRPDVYGSLSGSV